MLSYRVSNKAKQTSFEEVNDLIKNLNPGTIDAVLVIANWVRDILQFGKSDYTGGTYLIEEILVQSKNKDVSVLCDSYSRLFAIACQSLDIPARIVELEGHVVTEVFVREIGKWVMIDPTFAYYVTKGTDPLSVVEIITCYKEGISLTPSVFAEGKGDDCLYTADNEVDLKKIYLNGFTVVSDQSVDREKIKDTIFQTLQLPIAKIQFIDTNSTLIGYEEKTLRYAIMVTFIALILIAILIMRR